MVGAVDVDETACATYHKNHPEVDLINNDITDVCPSHFKEAVGSCLDLLAVCAPCQPFSNQNQYRSNDDERARLVLEALPFVKELKPQLVFFENVPGLGRMPVCEELNDGLKSEGYFVSNPIRVDAADLGVSQRRQRMILIAAEEEAVLEKAIEISKLDPKSVFDAIGDLGEPPVGVKNAGNDPLHYARRHEAITIERLKHIPKNGGSREALPEHLQLNCHKGRNKNSFPDTYGRLGWGDVAPTLTTGCNDLTKGRYAHPEQDRAITLREAARLQSFPDDYQFAGNASEIAAQIGNAVPPVMMSSIAASLFSALPRVA